MGKSDEVPLTADNLSKFTVPKLKEFLVERGLDTSGKKSDLVKRLADSMTHLDKETDASMEVDAANADGEPASPEPKTALKSPRSPQKDSTPAGSDAIPSKGQGSSPVKSRPSDPVHRSPVKPAAPVSPTKGAAADTPRSASPVKSTKRGPEDSQTLSPVKRTKTQSATLCLEKFTRPLNLDSLRVKLGSYGAIDTFWMNKIRSVCYVSYTSESDAKLAQSEMQGLEFQAGIKLSATLVTAQTMATAMEEDSNSTRNIYKMPPPDPRQALDTRGQPSRNPASREDPRRPLQRRDEDRARPRDGPGRERDFAEGPRDRRGGPVRYTTCKPSISYSER
ncbi:hypothetical protein HDV03_004908 [Kappamyces sp. JEL0829]|nr:hypothetical protein HDV03_004908 [Kappamyces sp. JEL0829]